MRTERERTLTVTAEAGMSNRLRVLLSGKALAEASGRAFAMLWQPTRACGCAFDDLFENKWNVRADVFFDRRRAFDASTTAWDAFPDWLAVTEPHLFVFHHGWLIQPARFARHRALETRCAEWMQMLQPVKALAARLAEFQEKFFRSRMIGAHLRRGDMRVVRPDTTDNLALALRQVDAWLEQAPDAGILLCTDDGARDPYTGHSVPAENIRAQFKQRYGARVVHTEPSSLDRRAPQAIQDALVDLWLLRATDFFVGTEGSSFSQLAVFGRTIPYALTGASTPLYQKRARWLKRVGLYERLAQMGRREFGKQVPYTYLSARYLRRLRIFLTRRI